MSIRFFLFFHIFVLLFALNSFAQYGSGVDGDILNNSGTTYTDNIRTHFTANALSGQPTITVNDASTFTNGDLCLIIQMLGTGVGRYEEKTISSKTATTITFTGNLIYSYNANGTTDLAQVIRIPQYNNITLKTAGDILTCNAWNGVTGGVCYFKVSGTLDTDADGLITVAGKGYRGGSGATLVLGSQFGRPGRGGTNIPLSQIGKNGENVNEGCSNMTTGTGGGGAGGIAASANGGSGGNYVPSVDVATLILYNNPGGDGINGANGNSGEGPGAGTAASAATNNSNSANWGATSGYDLLMGGGGAEGKQGLSSGRPSGGGGGAYGIANGFTGNCGVAANDGTAGGVGGAGGGILVMTVSTVQGGCVISVAGGNGSNGAIGSSGTTGGNGGASNGGANRGGGGGGRGGTGGGGSCPGHGGAAGSLRLGYFFPGYTFISSGGVKGAYGAGGVGGTGGNGASGSSIGADQSDDGQGGPGGYGGWSADGCIGSDGSYAPGAGAGKQTGAVGGAGAVAGCNDDSYCTSFAGGSAVVVLPIKLLSFTGFSKDDVNVLRWATLTEVNNDFFTLYRSQDSETWHKIVDVDGAGTSGMQQHYEFEDEHPAHGRINFYQLQQTDFDGKSSRSDIIAILPDSKSCVYFIDDEICVMVAEASLISYEIFSVSGSRLMRAGQLEVEKGVCKINTTELSPSVYLLRVQIGQRVESLKFIKR